MSTRPYATHGGMRIRQSYNRALIRYRDWCRRKQPAGASGDQWDRWVNWTRDREAALKATRDILVKGAEQRHRSKCNERKRDRKCLTRRGA